MGLLSKFEAYKNYGGYGLIGHDCRKGTNLVDQAFDEVVQELKLSRQKAFLFANSRCGRHVGDYIEGSRNMSLIKREIKKSIKENIHDLLAE